MESWMSATQSVLDHHLQCFGALDLDGLLSDYRDYSVLMTPDGTFRGRDAIRGFFAQAFDEFRQPGTTFAMKSVQVEGDCAFIFWDAETATNKFEAASDTFVVRDGAIAVQTYAAKVTPRSD
jgi:ketosteroid isomerase-like protein